MFLPHPRVKVSIAGSFRDREVACSASDRQGSNFESCVWRTVSSQSSHHPQEVLLAQFSLYVHKGGLKPDSFHFYATISVQETRDVEPMQFQCWSGLADGGPTINQQYWFNALCLLDPSLTPRSDHNDYTFWSLFFDVITEAKILIGIHFKFVDAKSVSCVFFGFS